jgi:hypothetical protein
MQTQPVIGPYENPSASADIYFYPDQRSASLVEDTAGDVHHILAAVLWSDPLGKQPGSAGMRFDKVQNGDMKKTAMEPQGGEICKEACLPEIQIIFIRLRCSLSALASLPAGGSAPQAPL